MGTKGLRRGRRVHREWASESEGCIEKKSGQTAGGIGAAATAAGILRSIEEIDRLESEISLLESGGKYTEADRLDDRLVDLMGETRDRLVSYTGGRIDPLTAWNMIESTKMRGRVSKLLKKGI